MDENSNGKVVIQIDSKAKKVSKNISAFSELDRVVRRISNKLQIKDDSFNRLQNAMKNLAKAANVDINFEVLSLNPFKKHIESLQNSTLAYFQKSLDFEVSQKYQNNAKLFQQSSYVNPMDFSANKLLIPNHENIMPLCYPKKERPVSTGPRIIINNYKVVEPNGQMTFVEYVEKLDEPEYIKKAILYKFDALAKDEIVFTATEWSLMKLIRKKPTIANTELAQIMGYGVRNIEEICAQIRKKMDFELIEDSKVKRNLLIQFVLS